MSCLSSTLASMFIVTHCYFIFRTSTCKHLGRYCFVSSCSVPSRLFLLITPGSSRFWETQADQSNENNWALLLLLLFSHLIGEVVFERIRYVVSVSKLFPFLCVFCSEPKWNYLHRTITWQTTRLCGHQGQTWNKGVVALAGSGRDLLSIFVAERGRPGELKLKSNLKM